MRSSRFIVRAHLARHKGKSVEGFSGTLRLERTMNYGIDRRQFLTGLAAFAASPAFAQKTTRERPAAKLPPRGEVVLRNAYLMTMDRELGDIPGGDVHIKDGRIAAVGKSLQAPGAAMIDAQRTIVLPGLVETHWHMWNTLLRSFGARRGEGRTWADRTRRSMWKPARAASPI
jgi:hypothetical protein